MPVAGKRPPKKWARRFLARLIPKYGRRVAGRIMGAEWYHHMSRRKRHAERVREYGRKRR